MRLGTVTPQQREAIAGKIRRCAKRAGKARPALSEKEVAAVGFVTDGHTYTMCSIKRVTRGGREQEFVGFSKRNPNYPNPYDLEVGKNVALSHAVENAVNTISRG